MELDMLLPEGKTCGDCVHAGRCAHLLGQSFSIQATVCDWSPSRFQPAEQKCEVAAMYQEHGGEG